MRIHDLLNALAEPGDESSLAHRIVGLAQGADRHQLAATFGLALRAGALDHGLGTRLRRRLQSLAETGEPLPDKATCSLGEEVGRLAAAAEAASSAQPRRAELRAQIAELQREQAAHAAALAAVRSEIGLIQQERGRLAEILKEVES